MIRKRNKTPSNNYPLSRQFPLLNKRLVQLEDRFRWLDIWLTRISHFSQFGLFIVTLGSLYFVVIPLYQKAVLDEEIAKKEVELKEVSAALEESYRRVREMTVRELVFGVGINCSGLMLPPSNGDLIGIHIPNRKPYAQEILEIDPNKCLAEASIRNLGFQNLRGDDKVILQKAIESLAREIDKKRAEYIDQSKLSWKSKRANDNANEYAELVRSRILTLKSFTWKQP